jgi:hypothetical protein
MNAEARSTFPNPPELWRLYTDEAVESAEGILNQPPPPIQGNFSKFGMPYTVSQVCVCVHHRIKQK